MRAIGEVSFGYQNITTGRVTPCLCQKNMILFGGADILASLLAGDASRRISHMYFQFQNTSGTPTPDSLSRDAGLASIAASSAAVATRDWLRVPVLSTPRVLKSPSDSQDYLGNAVVFAATSGASSTLAGEKPGSPRNYFAASGGNGPSVVFGAALAAAPVPNDGLRDIVFSRINLSTPLPLRAGFQITAHWTIKFS